MEPIIVYVETLLNQLPPLLQLLAGVLFTLGVMKIITLVVDWCEKKKSKE